MPLQLGLARSDPPPSGHDGIHPCQRRIDERVSPTFAARRFAARRAMAQKRIARYRESEHERVNRGLLGARQADGTDGRDQLTAIGGECSGEAAHSIHRAGSDRSKSSGAIALPMKRAAPPGRVRSGTASKRKIKKYQK